MKHFFGLLTLAVAAAPFACSSSSSSDNGGSSLQAPVITEVMPMTGGLHITWQNKQTDCDSIEGERMMGTDPYEMAFSVPGDADNKMDANVTHPMTHTYRLRCKKGADYSPYSNEKSGMPSADGG